MVNQVGHWLVFYVLRRMACTDASCIYQENDDFIEVVVVIDSYGPRRVGWTRVGERNDEEHSDYQGLSDKLVHQTTGLISDGRTTREAIHPRSYGHTRPHVLQIPQEFEAGREY